jgi:hypothetical protein
MDRSDCLMAECYGDGKVYCGYYDVACMLCEENENCPEEIDDDEEDDSFNDFDTKDDLYAEGYED